MVWAHTIAVCASQNGPLRSPYSLLLISPASLPSTAFQKIREIKGCNGGGGGEGIDSNLSLYGLHTPTLCVVQSNLPISSDCACLYYFSVAAICYQTIALPFCLIAIINPKAREKHERPPLKTNIKTTTITDCCYRYYSNDVSLNWVDFKI